MFPRLKVESTLLVCTCKSYHFFFNGFSQQLHVLLGTEIMTLCEELWSTRRAALQRAMQIGIPQWLF